MVLMLHDFQFRICYRRRGDLVAMVTGSSFESFRCDNFLNYLTHFSSPLLVHGIALLQQ
jgi:hypothetical protein